MMQSSDYAGGSRSQHVEEKRLPATLHQFPPGDAYNLLDEFGSPSGTFCDESARRVRRAAAERASSTKREVTFVTLSEYRLSKLVALQQAASHEEVCSGVTYRLSSDHKDFGRWLTPGIVVTAVA